MSKSNLKRLSLPVALLALLLCRASISRAADTFNILMTPTGSEYYEWNVTVASNNYSSGWILQTATQANYDSMATNPGGTNNAGGTNSSGSPTFNTQNFLLTSGLSYTPVAGNTFSVLLTGSSDWRQNSTTSTEAALIITAPSSTTVQNLLVLDTGGAVLAYKAPTLNGFGDVTNINSSGLNAYGYVSMWNPAADGSPLNTPITSAGTLTSGLEGALESNPGFIGTTNAGANISSTPATLISLPGGPAGYTSFEGAEFTDSAQPDSFREGLNGNFNQYITPTIYYAQTVPEPTSLAFLIIACAACLMRRPRPERA